MRDGNQSMRRAHAAIIALAAISQATATMATTVVRMDLATAADHAGQVISGRVSSVRSYWRTNPREVETEVVLDNVTYLKGANASASTTFTLTVPGGKVGDMQMRVSGAPTLTVGETWVMFLLPTYKTFPVVGVSQGAFRVISDSRGVPRVYNAASRPIASISAKGEVQVARRAARSSSVNRKASGGVRVVPRSLAVETAMSYDAFVNQLEPILSHSRDYRMTQNAGRRTPVSYTAKPLSIGNGPARSSAVSRMHATPLKAADSATFRAARTRKLRTGGRR